MIATLPGVSPAGQVELDVAGLRSSKGTLKICLTTAPDHFPDCQDDPAARRLTVAARDAAMLRFDGLPSADYAIALIHDENANSRLDTFAGIPREGIGFSRNPKLLFGPPRFSAARFPVGGQAVAETVKVRYFL